MSAPTIFLGDIGRTSLEQRMYQAARSDTLQPAYLGQWMYQIAPFRALCWGTRCSTDKLPRGGRQKAYG